MKKIFIPIWFMFFIFVPLLFLISFYYELKVPRISHPVKAIYRTNGEVKFWIQASDGWLNPQSFRRTGMYTLDNNFVAIKPSELPSDLGQMYQSQYLKWNIFRLSHITLFIVAITLVLNLVIKQRKITPNHDEILGGVLSTIAIIVSFSMWYFFVSNIDFFNPFHVVASGWGSGFFQFLFKPIFILLAILILMMPIIVTESKGKKPATTTILKIYIFGVVMTVVYYWLV